MTGSSFMPGRELSRLMYVEGVRPILARHAPGLPHAAALIGSGSDVLGYDTERSTDHDWGPRLVLFLLERDVDEWSSRLDEMLLRELPFTITGYATRFREFAGDPGVMHMATEGEDGLLTHRVRVTTVPAYLQENILIPSVDVLDVAAWLATPEQVLLEVTGGEVFHDDTGELTRARDALSWYPDDLWRYRLAATWKRIAQVEPFIGRAGDVDDDLGSQVIALSLVRDAMRLALLQERRYAPYAKWLGTAFARIEQAEELMPHLDAARFARSWQERERGIVEAMIVLGERQNRLALSEWVDPTPRPFHTRPFIVIDAERYVDALTRAISDPAVTALPPHLGGMDQFMDSTDALMSRELREALRAWLRRR